MLEFPISASPPPPWVSYFVSKWTGARSRQMGVPPPEVNGATIVVRSLPNKKDFESWADGVDKQIDAANRYYTETFVAMEQRVQEKAQQKKKERDQLLDQAGEWAASLDPPTK